MANADRDMVPLPAWDVQIAAAFEQRLRRARPYNRAQYIRIQATHLLSSSGPQVRQAGRGLLRCLVTSFPDDFNAKMAMEQLGRSLAGEGRLAEAGRALRETLRMCAQSPAGRSGTSGVAGLRLAEVILADGDAGRAGEAAACWRQSGRRSGNSGCSATRSSGSCSPRLGPPGSGAIRPRLSSPAPLLP